MKAIFLAGTFSVKCEEYIPLPEAGAFVELTFNGEIYNIFYRVIY